MEALMVAILGVVIAQACAMWWKIGRLEGTVKKSCPFGECPLYKRAQKEAAVARDIAEKEASSGS